MPGLFSQTLRLCLLLLASSSLDSSRSMSAYGQNATEDFDSNPDIAPPTVLPSDFPSLVPSYGATVLAKDSIATSPSLTPSAGTDTVLAQDGILPPIIPPVLPPIFSRRPRATLAPTTLTPTVVTTTDSSSGKGSNGKGGSSSSKVSNGSGKGKSTLAPGSKTLKKKGKSECTEGGGPVMPPFIGVVETEVPTLAPSAAPVGRRPILEIIQGGLGGIGNGGNGSGEDSLPPLRHFFILMNPAQVIVPGLLNNNALPSPCRLTSQALGNGVATFQYYSMSADVIASLERNDVVGELCLFVTTTGLGQNGRELFGRLRGPADIGEDSRIFSNIALLSRGSVKNDCMDLTWEQSEYLEDGLLYVEIRTLGCPDGELRGQVLGLPSNNNILM